MNLMRKLALIVALIWPFAAWAQPTPTPPTFRLVLPQPLSDPPNLTWAQQLVSRLRGYQFCATCGGIGGTMTTTPTAAATPTANNFIGGGTQSVTCADSGDGSPGSLTITPSASLVLLTVSDADGCNVSLSESGAASGRFVWIQNVSSPFARFTDQAGVLELPHDFHYLFQNGHMSLQYSGGIWTQLDANEPTSVALSLLELTDPSDIPTLPFNGECAILAASALSGEPLTVVCSSGYTKDIPAATDPCVCSSTGSASIQVGPNGSGVEGIGAETIAIGDGRIATGDHDIGIGRVSAGSTWVMAGAHSISIGEAGASGDISGDAAIQIGHTPLSQAGDNSICMGEGTTCDSAQDIGIGTSANPGGGGCIGIDCTGDAATFSFGSSTKAYHPEWIGSTSAPTLACGSISGNDAAGTITMGAGTITTCTVTFNATWRTKPSCFVYDETQAVLLKVVTTTTTFAFDSGATNIAGDTVQYGCPVS